MDRYGLIGYPLGHSFSISYFNQKFADEGINAKYENYEISSIDMLTEILDKHPNLKGLNVTIVKKNADGTVLETDTNVPYGTRPTYNGATPTQEGNTYTGWDVDITQGITGNTVITATYRPVYTATFKLADIDGGTTLLT